MTPIAWKRDAKLGGHVGSVDGRKLARIVRLGPSGWRWSYRGPSQVCAIVDEARLLKHAKEAVERLHASKTRDCTADDPADATRTKTARDHAAGEGPRGDQVRDRERPEIAGRVEGPHLSSDPKEAEKDGHVAGLRLNASGGTVDECRRATERSRQETEAGRRVGRAAGKTAPGEGGVREHQSSPSARREPSVGRVEGPHLWGQPLEVESTPSTMCDFREGETPSTNPPSAQLSLLGGLER